MKEKHIPTCCMFCLQPFLCFSSEIGVDLKVSRVGIRVKCVQLHLQARCVAVHDRVQAGETLSHNVLFILHR